MALGSEYKVGEYAGLTGPDAGAWAGRDVRCAKREFDTSARAAMGTKRQRARMTKGLRG